MSIRALAIPTGLILGLLAARPGVAQLTGDPGGQTRLAVEQSESKDWLQVVTDIDKKELVFFVGPVDLPANTGHHRIEQPPLLTGQIPIEGYAYGFEVEVVDANGEAITQRVLHHVNLIDPDQRELFSPIAQRLFAAGSETQSASMPKLLGVPLERGRRFMVSAMFHNPTDQSYPNAKLKVVLKYRREGWLFPLEVRPIYIDVMGHIGEKDFNLPPGRSEHSWEGSPAVEGRLLAAGGHLHDHAEKLVFEDLTEGEVLWETEPVVDRSGRVAEVPVGKFWWQGGIKLSPDHTYRLTVVYDNPTHVTLVDGGMGVLGGIFLPTGEKRWPQVDPADPRYLTDLRTTRETAERRARGMAPEGSSDHGHSHSHGG